MECLAEGSQGRGDNICGNLSMAALFSSSEKRQGQKTRDQLRGNYRNSGDGVLGGLVAEKEQ